MRERRETEIFELFLLLVIVGFSFFSDSSVVSNSDEVEFHCTTTRENVENTINASHPSGFCLFVIVGWSGRIPKIERPCAAKFSRCQVKLVVSTKIQNSPPLVEF